ncbi:MAG: hypothetical protein WC373_06745 [Smithella sp.]|jgi:hypothetical protein
MKTATYETSLGFVLTLKPLSPDILAAIREQVKFPDPPTYENELLGGGKETIFHTEETIETEEEKTAWAEYLKEFHKARTLFYEKKLRAIFRRCIIIDLPDDNEWKDLLIEDGIKIPDSPAELKYLFITTQTLGSVTDPMAIMTIVDDLSLFSEEDLNKVKNMFQRQIQGDVD